MGRLERHWTEEDIASFLYSIASDFVLQIEGAMEKSGLSQTELAERLGVSEGRVSQVLNHPGNLTLKKVIEYARAVGNKVALVAYDDDDPENVRGPINSEIFSVCWEKAGKPADFFSLEEESTAINAPPLVLVVTTRGDFGETPSYRANSRTGGRSARREPNDG